jgi:1-acyl-sn-glycerol-3-phosphate acyltransferase
VITLVLRYLFFAVIIRPLLILIVGLNVRRIKSLPQQGPAVIVANHNSHLDALALISLFPLRLLPQLHPLAASDYFLRNRWQAWIALHIIGIISIERQARGIHQDRLAGVASALEVNNIVIIFPEGSRGQPEQLSQFKSGVAHLARRYPTVPFYLVFIHGLGKTLPKGEALLVPFFCDIFIGEPLYWNGDKFEFMAELSQRMNNLAVEGQFPPWQ